VSVGINKNVLDYRADGGSYRVTLQKREKMEDEQERDEALKACHKRCAERTLYTLEKTGGIYIKLGQHLVTHATVKNYDMG
jgi:predicted unusual protein kinase regulating ubiquinone biosynthesis (AarF/ABC1/UbiB family)